MKAKAREQKAQPRIGYLPSTFRRWVPKQKAEVVAAVSAGTLKLEDACERYDLSAEEFALIRPR